MPMYVKDKKHGSLAEVAEMLDVSTARLRQLCAQGRVQGAFKTPSNTWLVPLPVRVISAGRMNRKIMMRSA